MGAPGLPDIGGVRVPDSRAAVEAEQLCRQESSPMLYAHALRSYYFAALLLEHGLRRRIEEAELPDK